jgi:signal transduction histidine kinase
MISTLRLARGLLMAPDPPAATRLVTRYCIDRFGVPVAAWVEGAEGADPSQLELLDVGATEAARAKRVRSQLQWVPRYGDLSPAARSHLRTRFCSLVGASSVEVLDAGLALVMVAGDDADPRRDLRGLEEVLRDAIQRPAEVGTAQRRTASLDLGLALTAHELRGPLLTSRMAIERVATAPEISGQSRRTLKGAAAVLAELARSVDAILHWAAGASALQTRRIDLSRVVRQAARETTGSDRSRLRLRTSTAVLVKADPRHLKLAIGNLIRNALEYSPAEVPVEVNVARNNGTAIVAVIDEGPGVSASARTSIFDPFVTGSSPSGDRSGRGLGLFIARRVVEAHGGRVWVESTGRGARFCVSLPVVEDKR